MPFTLAHPAIVIPLKGAKRFSLTALITGSMAPDFEFFFQMKEVKNIGHHWYGIFLFDFPVALLSCFLFHNLLHKELIINLPTYYRSRFGNLVTFNWNNYVKSHKKRVAISLLIGIASHILWDGFTHYDGLFISLIPILSITVFNTHTPVYFLLQVLFSIIGMAAIALTIHRMPVLYMPQFNTKQNIFYWPLFSFILVVILFIRLSLWSQYNSFWSVFMAIMGSICYSWLFVSVVFNNYSSKKKLYDHAYWFI